MTTDGTVAALLASSGLVLRSVPSIEKLERACIAGAMYSPSTVTKAEEQVRRVTRRILVECANEQHHGA